jgi:hypothetical protein
LASTGVILSSFSLDAHAQRNIVENDPRWKLVIIATNRTPDDPIEQRVSGAQTQILVRLTIGAMWEAWLVERRFLKTKIGRDYVPLLDNMIAIMPWRVIDNVRRKARHRIEGTSRRRSSQCLARGIRYGSCRES